MFCTHQWGRDGRGTMSCYRCGLTMPDPDYQAQAQAAWLSRAQSEAEEADRKQARWEAECEARRRAEEEVRRAAGVDIVQPLQLRRLPLPPGVATGRSLQVSGSTSMALASSIDPPTLQMTFPEGAWTPGRYVLVVWGDPSIPAGRLEWFCRRRAISPGEGRDALEAQRWRPFGEWARLSGMDVRGRRAAWCNVEIGEEGDYEFGVTDGPHGGRDAEPAWLARCSYTLWHPPDGTGRRGATRPAGGLRSSIDAGTVPGAPLIPGHSTPPVAWPGGTAPSAGGATGAPLEGLKPSWVALAICLCFPLGFYLLKRHPALADNKKWWRAGWAWAVLGGWVVALYTGVLAIGLLPILIPVGLYIEGRRHGSVLDALLHRVDAITAMARWAGVGTESMSKAPGSAEGEGLDPRKVALAIYFCFPYGLYLLWKHPTLSRNKTWWRVGGAWGCLASLLMIVVAANVDESKKPSSSPAGAGSVAPHPGSGTQGRRLMLVEAERLWDAGRREEALEKYSEFYRGWSGGAGGLDGGEKQALGPHLPNYYARFIQHCLDIYLGDPARYSGELKLAREQLDRAAEIGVPVPADLAERVRDIQKGVDDAYAARGKKYKAFKAVAAKLKRMPDRFAGMGEREKFNRELSEVVAEFEAVPFDADLQADEGRSIVELYEADVEGRYSGPTANEVDALVRSIYSQLINRR